MGKFLQKLLQYKNYTKITKNRIALLGILALLIAIPITSYIVQRETRVNSKAAEALGLSPFPFPLVVSNSQAVNYQFNATGGVAPYTYFLFGGNMPAGLSLSSSGLLSGTVLASNGSGFNFNLLVRDAVNTSYQAVVWVQVQALNTITPTITPSLTPTPSPTNIPTPTFTPIPTPTKTPTPTPTRTPTPTPTKSPTPTVPTGKTGDINGDNQVGLIDLSMLLSNWNTTNSTGDINHDGQVGILDLSMLLSNWGA